MRLLLGSAALCVAGTAGAQLSGAIFTTTPNGAIVNENVHYTAKNEVFLSGGPGPNAPPGAAGLPPGEYYFQVTDPSGKTLLSTDSARNRCVVVGATGYIVNQRCGAAYGPGSHLLNAKANTADEFVIQLIPFADTPNNGGVYKAWMTPVASYVGDINALGNQNCGNGCFHGFIPAASKTDNFKVRDVQTYCIEAWKFLVNDAQGTIDATAGWPILFGGNTYYTGPDGYVRICELVPGTYSIAEGVNGEYELVKTEVNGDFVEPPVVNVTVAVGRGNDRNPVVMWKNRDKYNTGCTKNCY
jgi:hypothetical protein